MNLDHNAYQGGVPIDFLSKWPDGSEGLDNGGANIRCIHVLGFFATEMDFGCEIC